MMKILLVAATPMEIAGFLQALAPAEDASGYNLGGHSWDVLYSGVGIGPATYSLCKALSAKKYDFVLQAGICGSFDKTIPLGSLFRVESEQFGDLGAEDHHLFLDVFELGLLSPSAFPFTEGKLPVPHSPLLDKIRLPAAPGITVHTVSGSDYTTEMRIEKYAPVLETMEGAALHYVCLMEGVPFAQVRAVSNYVEARNREAWNMEEAVSRLNDWIRRFAEAL